jgi:hypothetical protein
MTRFRLLASVCAEVVRFTPVSGRHVFTVITKECSDPTYA